MTPGRADARRSCSPRSTCCGTAASAPTSRAQTETHAEVGDKANDAIRVERRRPARAGASARAATSASPSAAGSSTPARRRGRINTDFIDNSAGVDTSDHEVNIKILLDQVVANGDLTEKQRNDLLASMTDEVGDAGAASTTTSRTSRWPTPRSRRRSCCTCTRTGSGGWSAQGLLDRELEVLPSRKEVAARLRAQGRGSRCPSWRCCSPTPRSCWPTSCSATDLADDPFLRNDLFSYFPTHDAADLPRADGDPPAAPRDHRDPGGQRPRQRRRHDVLPPALGGDRRHRRRAGAGELRGAGDLRLAGADRRDRLLRQQDRRRGADPDAARDAHAGRAGVAVAGQQPAAADGQRGAPSTSSAWSPSRSSPRCPSCSAAARPTRSRRGATRLVEQGRARGARGAGGGRCRRRTRCSTSSRPPSATTSTRSRSPACTSRSASGSGCPRWSPGSSRCRATTAGRRWRARRCATTCTPCTPSSPPRCWPAPSPSSRRRCGSPTGRRATRRGGRRAVGTLEEICSDEHADLARLSVGLRVVRTLLSTP